MPIEFLIRNETNTDWENILFDENIKVIDPNGKFASNYLNGVLEDLDNKIINVANAPISFTELPSGGTWNLTSPLKFNASTDTQLIINTNNISNSRLYFSKFDIVFGSIGLDQDGEFTLKAGASTYPADIKIGQDGKLYLGTSVVGVNAISGNQNLMENSDSYLSTQRAVKSYVDNRFTDLYNNYNVIKPGLLHLASDGVIIRNAGGTLEVRDPSDNGYGDLVCKNLMVKGGMTVVQSELVEIYDNFITLNSNVTSGTPSEDAGIDIRRGSQTEARLMWSEADKVWKSGIVGSELPINPAFFDIMPGDVSSNTSGKIGVLNYTARADHSHNLGQHNHTSTDGGLLTGDHNINAATASKFKTPRIINLSGMVTGSTLFDGSTDVNISCSLGTIQWTDLAPQLNLQIQLTGDVVGSGTFAENTGIASINAQVVDDSHTHTTATIPSLDFSKLINVPSPTITYIGAVTGAVTLNNLNSASVELLIDDGTF